MNIRDAILKAADHIERHPSEYDFEENSVPTQCGTPGCLIGWISHFAGLKVSGVDEACTRLGFSYGHIQHVGINLPEYTGHGYDTVSQDPKMAALALRGFADERFPAQDNYIPQDVVPWSSCAWKPKAVA